MVRLPALFGPGLKKNAIYDLLHDNCLDAIHPEGSFQYYDVRRLWRDLQVVLRNNLRMINFATTPIETREIVQRFFPGQQIASQSPRPAPYDMRTRYAEYSVEPTVISTARSKFWRTWAIGSRGQREEW